MVQNLKKIVISLGIVILLLFSVTIVALIYKFKNNDIKIVENLELSPISNNNGSANSFEISGKKLYVGIFTENNTKVIKVFDLKTGLQISKIIVSREK
ncbi:MAG: hypothetical protein CNE97_02535 [alpha proteobacterium MED-G10]|nr:MAG: hypothetical protein CNE97_02535 [alpha proteobacterium MED-G10]|tara:strand:+ start:34 stop:327 length:294 start_codon:yes stop_codon:yes gene_type:complete